MGVDAEVERLAIHVAEVELLVHVVEDGGGVARLVAGTSYGHVEVGDERFRIRTFLNGDGDGTFDLLLGLEVDVGPFGVVDELIQGRLQVLENCFVTACNLSGVDADVALQLLRGGKIREEHADDRDKRNE